jgi:hypothetical protein
LPSVFDLKDTMALLATLQMLLDLLAVNFGSFVVNNVV